jgi:hypothetical protein
MKFNRKHYGMKRRSSGGQAILEYIIIIALVAVAALPVLGLFGDRIRQLIASVVHSFDSNADTGQVDYGSSKQNLPDAGNDGEAIDF